MLKSKAATYATLTLSEIARRHGPRENLRRRGLRASEVAEALHLPAAYTAKILTQLTRAGILESGRGPRGGFFLARDPRQISLLDVVAAVERLNRTVPVRVEPAWREVGVRIDVAFERALDRARQYLASVVLAELLGCPEGAVEEPAAIR